MRGKKFADQTDKNLFTSKKAAFTKPSRGTSDSERRTIINGNRVFRFDCERCRLTRGAAFTLAEVLITLGIIGVVAAITVPSLIANYQKQKNLTILKKAYSDISRALEMFDVEYNCGGDLRFCAPGKGQFLNKFTHYLYAKQGMGSPISVNGYKWYKITYNKMEAGYNPALADPDCTTSCPNCQGAYGFLLSSKGGEYYVRIGPYMYDNSYSINIDKYGYFRARIFIYTNPKHLSICKGICSDKDSRKARVKEGLEAFELYITDTEKIMPNGFPECGRHYYCTSLTEENCSSTTKKYSTCLQKIIQDSWQINYL